MASGKKLVIVESPAKCKKIEEYLGAGYMCVASFGHLRELSGLNQLMKNIIQLLTIPSQR